MCNACPRCNTDCTSDELVTLKPCGCVLCFRCVIRLQAQAASSTDVAFTHCEQEVKMIATRTKKREREGFDEEEIEYPKKKKLKRPPSQTNDYIRDIKAETNGPAKDIIGKEGMLLTEQTMVKLDENDKVLVVPLAFSAVPGDGKSLSEDVKTSLVKQFRFFHSVLLPSSKTGSAPLLSREELLKEYLTKDGRILLLCMLAVATGCTSMAEFQARAEATTDGAKTLPSSVLSIGMATDLLMRCVNEGEVGPAVKCMSNVFRHAGDALTQDTLAKFKATTSATAGGIADAKGFIKACLEPEIKYTPNLPVFMIADNVNWKILHGRKSGTVESWTLVSHRMPRESEVQNHYGPDAPPRTPKKDWEEDFLNKMDVNEIIRKVFLASEEDCKTLHELLLIHIKAVMMSYKNLAGRDYEAMDEAKDYYIKEGIPRLERVFEEQDLDLLKEAVAEMREIAASIRDEDESDTTETLFSKNNVKASIPIDLNFAETATIKERFEYLIQIADAQVQEYEEAKAASGGADIGPEPISKRAVFFNCDGDPVKTGMNVKAKDFEGRYSRIIMILGIFHAFMEIFKKGNNRERDMLKHLIAPFYSKKIMVKPPQSNIERGM